MSPVALKWKSVLRGPAIAPVFKGIEFGTRKLNLTSSGNQRQLAIVHNASKGKTLLEDWMQFTNILGGGILHKIS